MPISGSSPTRSRKASRNYSFSFFKPMSNVISLFLSFSSRLSSPPPIIHSLRICYLIYFRFRLAFGSVSPRLCGKSLLYSVYLFILTASYTYKHLQTLQKRPNKVHLAAKKNYTKLSLIRLSIPYEDVSSPLAHPLQAALGRPQQ